MRHPAAFINAIADSRDFKEAIKHLQLTWDELCEAKRDDEIAWVIVRDLPSTLGYFDGYKFVPNNLEAIRFARKVDAERWLTLMHAGSTHSDRVEEHMWVNNS